MYFSPEYFKNIDYTESQINQYFANAKKDLKTAQESNNTDVIFRFCYDAIIKLGISLIAKNGYKVRSIPGHHIKILDALSEILNLEDEIDYFHRIRRKRNIDLYEGGTSLTQKESKDLLKITENIFSKITT